MRELSTVFAEDRARFEVMPFGGVEEQAAALPRPVHLTVTCSPTHGPDQATEAAARLSEQGHSVTVHLAARMVRDQAHLDGLLARMQSARIADVFLIGGDVEQPAGEYTSAAALLPRIDEHPRRPRTIGIAAYPESHPFIPDEELDTVLCAKARRADYVTTQMCFDADALRSWVAGYRERGMTLPVLLGMPGKVARRRLLSMSVRIGVGPSIKFLRKQNGLLSLLSRRSTTDRLHGKLAPMLDEPQLNIAGFQYFTFNQLTATWEWHAEKLEASGRQAVRPAVRGRYPQRRETTA